MLFILTILLMSVELKIVTYLTIGDPSNAKCSNLYPKLLNDYILVCNECTTDKLMHI